MAFMNDMSKTCFRAFQQMCDLNIQLTQTMLEESTMAGNSIFTPDRQTDVLSAAASRAQPATDTLRAYQQHISRVAADTQVDMARVAEQHVQETTRTARALADEVARVATEETDRSMRIQQEAIRKFSDPFHTGNGPARGNGGADIRPGASMQGAGQGSQGGAHADMQGNIPVQSGSPSGRTGGAARKES